MIWYNPADGSLHDDMDGAALELPIWPQGMIEATPAQIDSVQNPDLTPAQLWSIRQQQAQAALTDSDRTIMRCYESAVAVPVEWATYRKALRAILSAASGDPTQALPVRPAYPVGT